MGHRLRYTKGCPAFGQLPLPAFSLAFTDALLQVRLSTGMSTVVYLKTDIAEFVDSWEKLLQESADDDTKTLFIGRRVVRVKERQQVGFLAYRCLTSIHVEHAARLFQR